MSEEIRRKKFAHFASSGFGTLVMVFRDAGSETLEDAYDWYVVINVFYTCLDTAQSSVGLF